ALLLYPTNLQSLSLRFPGGFLIREESAFDSPDDRTVKFWCRARVVDVVDCLSMVFC
ncbi:unnamed protein product, partial [Callosobruchus maculatus]